MILSNEFATVDIEIDNSANDPRLKIEDTSTGKAIYLDPLELQGLAWSTHRNMAHFTVPLFKEQAMERLIAGDTEESQVRAGERHPRSARER